MCDLFSSLDARSIVHNKRILFLGDSNVRSYYKDLVFLLENNRLLSANSLKNKLGTVVPYDVLKQSTKIHKGRDYFEVREYKHKSMHITYHFLTKCYTPAICLMFKKFKEVNEYPHVIIMNSCLWDISRWGPNGVLDFKDNLVKLMKLLKSCLPEETLFIWTSVPPISNQCRGGLLVRQVQFLQHSLRFDVMEGNMFARDTVVSHGYDFLDIHYYLRMQIHWRAVDGVHWLPHAVRHATNLILTHICVALNLRLPGNITGESLQKFKSHSIKVMKEKNQVNFPKLQSVALEPSATLIKKPNCDLVCKLNLEENVCSPMRKAIKQRIKCLQENDDSNHSILNSSVSSVVGDESFKLELTLELPVDKQCSGSGSGSDPSFDVPYDIEAMVNSPIPHYKDPEEKKLMGPIRSHCAKRRFRLRRGPYSFE